MKMDNVIALDRGRPGRSWNFQYPHQLVRDPGLDMDQKRAILTAWASDKNAVQSMPMLRHLPGTPVAVTVSAIMDAWIQLDRLAGVANDDEPPPSPANRQRRGHLRAWEVAA